MTKEELAARLNGREHGDEMEHAEEQSAKEAGLIVIFGESDDLAEMRGAAHDEVGCYDGGELRVDAKGFLPEWDQVDKDGKKGVAAWLERDKSAKIINAVWGSADYSWQYKTAIPHACFDIMEGKEKYCRGIVFSVNDLA